MRIKYLKKCLYHIINKIYNLNNHFDQYFDVFNLKFKYSF